MNLYFKITPIFKVCEPLFLNVIQVYTFNTSKYVTESSFFELSNKIIVFYFHFTKVILF